MSPLPERLRDRWANRIEPADDTGAVYWHVLIGADPVARAAAADVRLGLQNRRGLHLTPLEWLHMTLFVVGYTDSIDSEQLVHAIHEARDKVDGSRPIEVSTGRVLYHPEAIMLAVEPLKPLRALRDQIEAASSSAFPSSQVPSSETWIPHITVAYSTTAQPAAPIIEEVGVSVSKREFVIDEVSLVIQWGSERKWNWQTVGRVKL